MRCVNCPLCYGEWDYYGNDGEAYCAVTGTTITDSCITGDADVSGCRRTNQWINKQDIKEWQKKHADEEAEMWSAIVKEMEDRGEI